MDDLVRWLSVQLDADTARATAARGQGEGRWHHEGGYHTGRVEDERGETVVYDEGAPTEEEAAHIAEWDPARVLREIDAKRALLTAVKSARRDHNHWHVRPPADAETRMTTLAKMDARWAAWQFVLGQLAKPYADHPEFRDEWRSIV